MKVSVIISVCDNRFEMFGRSLDTWVNQTELKNEFELIIVDDSERNDLFNLCKEYNKINGLQFQLIRINNSKCDLPITTFTPVLTNNVGMRAARGDVVCITGPETLQAENNIKFASSFSNRQECGYGLVYKSNKSFVNLISKQWDGKFKGLLDLPGARADCLTKPPHPPAYYYFVAVKKKYVEKIGGLDERFAQGFCGEDDDFANRMRMSGITPVFEHNIIGIHQDHSSLNTEKHNMRFNRQDLKQRNLQLIKENLNNYNYIANRNHNWGDEKVIVYKEILGG